MRLLLLWNKQIPEQNYIYESFSLVFGGIMSTKLNGHVVDYKYSYRHCEVLSNIKSYNEDQQGLNHTCKVAISCGISLI